MPEFKGLDKRYFIRFISDKNIKDIYSFNGIKDFADNGYEFEWLDETAQQAPEPVEELQGLKDENSHLKLVVDELSELLEEKRNRIRELVDNRK